ncbi:MAG: HNH endonuclease [Cupriavidus sp.]|nr:MAG: HNH endonuclease [Cupriavidus sp.]
MAKLSSLPPLLTPLAPTIDYLEHKPRSAEGRRLIFSPWRKWYSTARWRALRLTIFRRDDFTCQMCGRLDGNTSRLIADHREPHRGDAALFWSPSNLQTLCKPCHDGPKQRMEQRGA